MIPLAEPSKVAMQPRFRGRRITFVYPVQIQALDRLSPTLRVHATNLSMGGMFVYALEPLPIGTRVRIALEVKGRPHVFAEAEVRWVRDCALKSYPWCPGFGVRFVKLSPKATALVHHLVTVAGRRQGHGAAEPMPEVDGVPVPGPQLPSILDLNAPLDDHDLGTKQMFPIKPEEPPRQAALPAPRPPFAAVVDKAPPGSAWRWLRWGLAAAAVAGWVAAFSNMHPGNQPAQRASVARTARPSVPQR